MTRERIKDFKEIILPFFTIYFLKENYEGLGKSDAEEFEKDFNEILNLAAKALEQESCEDAISREEALKVINKMDIPEDMCVFEIKSHIGVEISTLPPVQPKPIECEDAISRKYAIGAVADLFEMSEYPHPYPQGKPIRLKDIKEKLKQLPSVQPKPKTGHWIYERCDMYSCSVCHHWHTDLDEKMNYCPNCGAKMIEQQGSEE